MIKEIILACLILICSYPTKKNTPLSPCNCTFRLEKIATMDTITVIIEGEVYSVKNKTPKSTEVISLTNSLNHYEVVSDSLGKFKFQHISAGKYHLKTTKETCLETDYDSIELNTGEICLLTVNK